MFAVLVGCVAIHVTLGKGLVVFPLALRWGEADPAPEGAEVIDVDAGAPDNVPFLGTAEAVPEGL